jgi:hypothetical protein
LWLRLLLLPLQLLLLLLLLQQQQLLLLLLLLLQQLLLQVAEGQACDAPCSRAGRHDAQTHKKQQQQQ